MPRHKLCVIPGDGIGPEVTGAAIRVLQAATSEIGICHADAGWQVFCDCGNSVPDETLAKLRECRAGLFGAVSSPARKVDGYRSAIITLRKVLDMFANLRPIKGVWAEVANPDIDLLIVRENTEGLYSGIERSDGERAVAEKVVTRQASVRLAQLAIDAAIVNGIDRATIVHKANILPIADGLFRDTVREVLESSSTLAIDESLVDIAAYRLVSRPETFQLLITMNLYGDILSDLAAHWCGGMGRAPSLNLGNEFAIAEPVHGSAPDIAGQGVADPTATILSLSLLCRYYWKEFELADRIEQAAITAIRQRAGAPAFSTSAITDQVIEQLRLQPHPSTWHRSQSLTAPCNANEKCS